MNTEIFDLGKIGITIGGEYDNKVIYEKLTIVLYKGKSYISTKTTQGIFPDKDIRIWQLVAEAKDAYHMLIDAGKTTLSEVEFLEQLVDATKKRYIVQGNVINIADEEDLTVEHSDLLGIDTLKLANRDNTNGMGYVIIRKNKSFAEQVTNSNTIYEIRYNYDRKYLTKEELATLINNMIEEIKTEIKIELEKQKEELKQQKIFENKLNFAKEVFFNRRIAIIKLKSSYQCLENGLRYTIGKGAGKYYSLRGVSNIIDYLDKKGITEYCFVSEDEIKDIDIKGLKNLDYKKF